MWSVLHPSLFCCSFSHSLSHSSFPPHRLKTWISLLLYQETHAHAQASTQCRSLSPILWTLCKLCEVELTRISIDKQDLFHCKLDSSETERASKGFFFPSALPTVAEEEDCCLCLSAVEPLGIIREYCWMEAELRSLLFAAAVRPLLQRCRSSLSSNQALHRDRIDSQQQHCPPPFLPTLLFFLTGSYPVLYTVDIPLTFYSTRSLNNLLHLSFICLWICPFVSILPTSIPLHTSLPAPFFHFPLEGHHQSQSMGLLPLSPPSCPLPCLCSEAVCCGSTNARVRRKLCTSHGLHAWQSWAKGSRRRCLFVFWDVRSGWSIMFCSALVLEFVIKVQGKFRAVWIKLFSGCQL